MAFQLVSGVLNQADRHQLLPALARTKGKSPAAWMPAAHAAKKGAIPSKWSQVRHIPSKDLVDAVAFAGPTHLVDGWSYLARALASTMAGDPHAARHLSYYAQLRAGLSILASMGVGVFNGVNFIINSKSRPVRLDEDPTRNSDYGAGTHAIVWLALDDWAKGSNASLFLSSMRIRGVSVEDALLALWPGFAATTSALAAMRAWGLDLNRGHSEHGFRKISSYVPHCFNPLLYSTSATLKYIAGLWELLEPSGIGQFDRLDRFLLRSIMWGYHSAVDPSTSRAAGAIGQRYEELPNPIRTLLSKDFLLGQVEATDPQLLSLARSTRSPAMAVDMIARAILLLRTATGFVHSNLVDAGLNLANGDLRPWLDGVAAERGFWDPANPLPNASDLWADVSVGLAELSASTQSAPSSLHDWATAKIRGIPVLSESDRVAVWALSA